MAGAINAVYAAAGIGVAILGLLFMILGTGERETGLFVGGAVGIVLLIGLGVTLLV